MSETYIKRTLKRNIKGDEVKTDLIGRVEN